MFMAFFNTEKLTASLFFAWLRADDILATFPISMMISLTIAAGYIIGGIFVAWQYLTLSIFTWFIASKTPLIAG